MVRLLVDVGLKSLTTLVINDSHSYYCLHSVGTMGADAADGNVLESVGARRGERWVLF